MANGRMKNDSSKAKRSWLQTGSIKRRTVVNILTGTAETEADDSEPSTSVSSNFSNTRETSGA